MVTKILKQSLSILVLLVPSKDNSNFSFVDCFPLLKSTIVIFLSNLPFSVEYTTALHASNNAEVERILEQPEKKRSTVGKKAFIKGQQETLDDIITLISNVMMLGRYWVTMKVRNEATHFCIIRLLFDLVYTLSSAE